MDVHMFSKGMKNSIYPCLWFDGNIKEAATLYSGVFGEASVISENQTVLMLEISGQKFMLLNGGPEYKINPSISIFVTCKADDEVDRIWNALIEGGSELMPLGKYDWNEKFGWLSDKFGVSWQLMKGSIGDTEQRFVPALMFTGAQNGNAQKAVDQYSSIFSGSEVKYIMRYGKDQNEVEGNIAHAQFTMGKQMFVAMDSSFQHEFTFNEGVSLVVECNDQEEVDYYWEKLTEGGEEVQCGWLKDRFGVSWQVVPSVLYELMSDPSRSERVVQAFLKMKKFDIDKLLKA
jgi:predicted 3-demethylubiquinone-9 3-methyltransferase (glyoxalase superfamily)